MSNKLGTSKFFSMLKFLWQYTEAAIWRCFTRQVFLKILQNSQDKTCARVFLNKVGGFQPATLLKRRLQHMCFPNVATFSKKSSGRLLLNIYFPNNSVFCHLKHCNCLIDLRPCQYRK